MPSSLPVWIEPLWFVDLIVYSTWYVVYTAPESDSPSGTTVKHEAANKRIGYLLRVWLATSTSAAETVL